MIVPPTVNVLVVQVIVTLVTVGAAHRAAPIRHHARLRWPGRLGQNRDFVGRSVPDLLRKREQAARAQREVVSPVVLEDETRSREPADRAADGVTSERSAGTAVLGARIFVVAGVSPRGVAAVDVTPPSLPASLTSPPSLPASSGPTAPESGPPPRTAETSPLAQPKRRKEPARTRGMRMKFK